MKTIFCATLLLFVLIFLIPQGANAVTIDAIPEETTFGPNDNIRVDLNIHGYDQGPILWVAHRPDGSIISGSLDQFKGGKVTHGIMRNAFDNYFGNWSINYTYNGVKQNVSFKVQSIKLSAIPDKLLYYEPDIMKINVTTSFYNPVAVNAQFFHLNFYDNNGNLIKNFKQIDFMALHQSTIYNFPISQIADRDNPPGKYKFRVQYYNVIVEVPFVVEDIRKLMTIFLQTDKQSYNMGDSVNLHLLLTRVKESSGIMKITDPLGNTTISTFPVDSINTNLRLENITTKPGIYNLVIQYAGTTQTDSFQVTTISSLESNTNLEIFLDKLKYRPGEIISAKVHTPGLITNSLSYWFEDPNGKQSQKVSAVMKSVNIMIPHEIDKDDLQGIWKIHIDYGGGTRSTIFFVQGTPVEKTDMISPIKFSKPRLLMTLGSAGNVNFKNPKAIAVDSMNNIYVVDSGNSQIKKFDSTGKLLLSWGSLGTGNGQFKNPSGILIDQKYVYIADTGNVRIQKFDKNGTFVLTWGTYGDGRGLFHTPIALVEDKSGDIFVSDSGTNRIQIFDPIGKYRDEIRPVLTGGGNFNATNSIVFDSENNFYVVVSDANRILKYSNIGNFINFFGSSGNEEGRFDNPTSIGIDSNGYLFVTDTNNYRIQKFDSDGTILVSWGSFGTSPGQFKGPIGISLDSMNNLYVVDKINNNVQKFAPIGSADEISLPSWIKNNARWWSEGLYTDNDFVTGIKYMIKQGIIQSAITLDYTIPTNSTSYALINATSLSDNIKIPRWFKTNADWWTNGLISDKEFTDGIQYLISAGIIQI